MILKTDPPSPAERNSRFFYEAEVRAMSWQYDRCMIKYDRAMELMLHSIQCMKTSLEQEKGRTMIRSVSSRIKSLDSTCQKLKRLNLPVSLDSVDKNITDVAGIRIICSYLEDIYLIRDYLVEHSGAQLVTSKDYIENAKPSGYRSLHLIFCVPVVNGKETTPVYCEIQLRTTAMDSWAALEHQLRYKKGRTFSSEIHEELSYCADLIYESDVRMQRILNMANGVEDSVVFPRILHTTIPDVRITLSLDDEQIKALDSLDVDRFVFPKLFSHEEETVPAF